MKKYRKILPLKWLLDMCQSFTTIHILNYFNDFYQKSYHHQVIGKKKNRKNSHNIVLYPWFHTTQCTFHLKSINNYFRWKFFNKNYKSLIEHSIWLPTLFSSFGTRQTNVDLTVPPNMAATRVGSGNTRITTSQKGQNNQRIRAKTRRTTGPGRSNIKTGTAI